MNHVFIDGENISSVQMTEILEWLHKPHYICVFLGEHMRRTAPWVKEAQAVGADIRFIPTVAGKGSVDIAITAAMAICALESDPRDPLTLVAGDRDYLPLLLALRQKGRAVALIHSSTARFELVRAATHAFELSPLPEDVAQFEGEAIDRALANEAAILERTDFDAHPITPTPYTPRNPPTEAGLRVVGRRLDEAFRKCPKSAHFERETVLLSTLGAVLAGEAMAEVKRLTDTTKLLPAVSQVPGWRIFGYPEFESSNSITWFMQRAAELDE